MMLAGLASKAARGLRPRRACCCSAISLRAFASSDDRFTTLGLLRESFDPWERRTPLTPHHVEDLVKKHDTLRVIVQPSSQRIFSDSDYLNAGATVDEDLSPADIILGVKRPKLASTLSSDKTYLFFSHTIKGQPENMPLLQECLDRHVQLIDYERMMQEPASPDARPRRLVAFGRFAGMAGAIDSFAALGKRLLHTQGVSTPFLTCPPAWMHDSVDEAQACVRRMGERIAEQGLTLSSPLVIAVTGAGGCVHGGVMEILQLVPHELVTVDELPNLSSSGNLQHKIYLCPVGMSDIFRHCDGKTEFSREDFAERPQHYRCMFGQKVAPFVDAIVNCVYWDARYPRLLTKKQMKRIYNADPRLLLVTDISCDVGGSIEFLERTTTIERPFFQYDPRSETEVADEIGKDGVTVMGVDILPAELPKDASEHFSRAVVGVLDEMVQARAKQVDTKGVDSSLLSEGLRDAFITTVDGHLTTGYRYLETLRKRAPPLHGLSASNRGMILSLEGHLFDSGLINKILDVIEEEEGGMELKECFFPPHSSSERILSSVVLHVTAGTDAKLKLIEAKIQALVDLIPRSEATMVRVDEPDVDDVGPGGRAQVTDPKRQHQVLLLGAGRVSQCLVEFLGGSNENVFVTVASDVEKDARRVAAAALKGRHVVLDAANEVQKLSGLVEEADLVISLLPAPMHPIVAQECILHKSDLVTASYESEEMRELQLRALGAGIVILNEVGLDPGLDHMSAMKIIDDVKFRGGAITKFASVCGGLPAPEAANNPLHYKFSWSPRGVIRASQNPARYRWEDRMVRVPGSELLASAAPFVDAWSELGLECLPNRDSLLYEKAYNIQGASTVFRGTLRYRGFSKLMDIFQNAGLFDSVVTGHDTWSKVVDMLRMKRGGFENLRDFFEACADEDVDAACRAMDTLEWLGVLDGVKVDDKALVVDAFCDLLEQRLCFEEGERDMVVMHHTIEAAFENGCDEIHVSSLQVFGDSKGSAMAKTVGYTAAASAELILDGALRDERGLLLPTSEHVYLPVLEKVAKRGIVFEESASVVNHTAEHKA